MSDPQKCLQMDVGNSSAKWRLVCAGEEVSRGRYVPGDQDSRDALLNCVAAPDEIWVSSVASGDAEHRLCEVLAGRWTAVPWFARTASKTGDLANSYADPSRMGVDRWLAMLGARRRTQLRACVVDAGSALTIDIIAADGRHEGGYILPGPELMERALLLDTDRVRFAEDVGYGLAPGRSTAEAVRHGIAVAQAGALSLVLARTADDPPVLLFCGGAGPTLMELVAASGELVPDLVFEGLEAMAALRDR